MEPLRLMPDSHLSPVVLHVGFEKTGTKSIQHWLREHEKLLASHRMRFPRGWLRLNCHQELPLTLMRLDRLCSPRELGDEWRDPAWRDDVNAQVRADLEAHPNELTILSSENLDLLRHDDEFQALRDLVGNAVIVAYLRDPAEWLVALRAQYLTKNAEGRTLSSDPEAYNYLGPGTWRADYQPLLRGWLSWFDHVYVANYDEVTARDGSVIPSFLRFLHLPAVDVDVRLNGRSDATPRPEGNRRTNGLRFGQEPSSQLGGNLSATSMPLN